MAKNSKYICLIAFLLLHVAYNGAHFVGNYDEGVYLLTAKMVGNGGDLYSEVFFGQPPLWAELSGLAHSLFGLRGVKGLLGLLALGILIGSIKLAGIFCSKPIAPKGFAFLALSPFFIFLSHRPYAEIVGGFFAVWALYFAAMAFLIVTDARNRLFYACLCGLFLSMSTLSKLSAAVTFIPVFVAMGICWKKTPAKDSGSYVASLAVFCLAGLIPLAWVLFNYPLEFMWPQVIGLHTDVISRSYSQRGIGIPLMFYFGAITDLAALLTVLLFVLFGFKHLKKMPFFLFAWSIPVAHLLFLAQHTPAFMHHSMIVMIPSFFIVALMWRSPDFISKSLQLRFQKLALYLLPLFIFNLAHHSVHNFLEKNGAEQDVAALTSFCAAHPKLITDKQLYAYLADCDVPYNMVDTSNVRIHTGSVTLENIQKVVEEEKVKGIYATDRFWKIAGFKAWLDKNFEPTALEGLYKKTSTIMSENSDTIRENHEDSLYYPYL